MASRDSTWTPLWRLSQEGSASLSAGLRGGAPPWADRFDESGGGFAHEVAREGSLAAMDALLAVGLPSRTQDKDGRSPLMWAVKNRHAEVAGLLIEVA